MASSTLVPVDLGVSSDGAGGRAEGHAVDWRAARSHRGTSTEERDASGVMANWMAQTRQGGRRVRNGPRRAGAGWAVKGHLGALAFTRLVVHATNRVPEVSLRRWRVLRVAARSAPCGAARGAPDACDEL